MNPFTHAVIASKLEKTVGPANRPEYYWGAIAPDIRYPAGMQRRHTHLPPWRIVELISIYPHLESFLQGYLVHCLSDEIGTAQILHKHFFFRMVKKRMTSREASVILELFCFENEDTAIPISGAYNEVFRDLGISHELSGKYALSIRQYMRNGSSGENLSGVLRLLDLENDSRMEQYMAAADRFQRSRLLKNALFLAIRVGNINRLAAAETASHYRRYLTGL